VRAVPCPKGGYQPRALADAAGAIHLLYLGGEPARADLYYVHSEDVGATFSEPLRVNSIPGGVDGSTAFRGASLALGEDGILHVVWLASEHASPDPPRRQVVYAHLVRGGKAFEAERGVVHARFGMDGTPALALRGPQVFVFWHAPGDEPMPTVDPTTKKGAARHKPEEEPIEDEPQVGPGESAPLPLRHVWMVTSSDGGKTFDEERAIDTRGDGASPGCSLAAACDEEGTLYVLYRSHIQRMRGTFFLVSENGGKTFEPRFVDLMRALADIPTGESLKVGPRGLIAAWESKGTVMWSKVRKDTDRVKGPMSPKNSEGWCGRPALEENTKGGLVLAWFEGTQQKPERLAWQLFAAVERRIVSGGKLEGVNELSTPAVVARPDDGFLVFY
jgi:hypothetical protein